MKRKLRVLHRYYYLFQLAVWFFILYPFLYFFSQKKSRYKSLNFIRRTNAYMASLFSGIIYKVHYKTILNWDKTYIFCANHSSNLDIFALSATLKGNYFFMGKHELLDSIFTRRYFQTIDIPVDRESKIGAYRALKKAEQRLQDGLSLVIFPEGAIDDHYPPRLMPFKNGTFKLAIENKVAIVPVSLKNNWELLWDDGKKYGSKPGISHIYVHEPIETIGLTLKDEENLKNKVFEIVHSKLSYNK